MSRKVTRMEVAIVVVLFALTNLVSAIRQRQNTFDGGLAWERPYYTMAGQFASHAPIATEAPYVYRVATPFLVSLVSPGDLIQGFRIVNCTGSFIASILLVFWLQSYVTDLRTRLLLVALFFIQWDAPPRYMYHSPVHVDAWYFVFVLAGMMAVERYRQRPSPALLGGIAALSFIGVFFREIVLILPLSFLAVHQPFSFTGPEDDRKIQVKLLPIANWLPLVSGVLAFGIIHLFAHKTGGYSFLATIIDFLYSKAMIGYLQAWLLAFGPVLFILLFDWRKTRDFLWVNQYFIFFLLIGAWLGFFGGTDTERLLYWSMPGVYILLGISIERHCGLLQRWPIALAYIFGQVMTSRILWTTPDYPTDYKRTFPILQQFGSHVQFLDLFSFHGFRNKEIISISEFFVFGVFILWLMKRVQRQSRAAASPARHELTEDSPGAA